MPTLLRRTELRNPMSFVRAILVLAALSVGAMAHPMGNFSVNHYSRLNFHQSGVDVTYVLDLAEIPTFQLLGPWQAGSEDQKLLDAKTRGQAKEWVANLALLQAGQRVSWKIKSITSKTADGAGGMPTLRIAISAQAPLQAGQVSYNDLNFPGRAGWKEIVIDHTADAVLHKASQGASDLSAALTVYPTDPSVTPPQDLAAAVDWSPKLVVAASAKKTNPIPESPQQMQQPAQSVTPATSTFTGQQPTAPGSVVRGDFLSRMLQRKQLGSRLILLCILAAIGLGALHAMSPGHGKTIVAAYLVGSRGSLKHAGLLGLVVTFTHTFTVFLLGLGVLFFQQYVVPEKIVPVLGILSGLSIVLVGMSLLYKRAKALMATTQRHEHRHAPSARTPELAMAYAGNHNHSQDHADHDHDHDHNHDHDHGNGLVHSHGGSTHSHMIEGAITPGSLIALGIGGGMVPCPSALILMLSAIALGRPGFGLLLLIGFSAGLSMVLIGIGALALYARHLLPDSKKASQHPAFRLIPVFSAVVVIVLGLVVSAVSAGWIQPMRFLS
jgi:nickel/cobalt transporter (NicO) family protein